MKKHFRNILLTGIVISLLLAIVSFINVRNSGTEVQFILWAYPLGAFIWEDLLVFSIANIIACIFVILINDFRYIFIYFLSFWFVRSIGETFYWFLQQFCVNPSYPHDQYSWENSSILSRLLGNLSDQKYFIINQISWQIVTVFCICGFVFILKRWKYLSKISNIK